MTHMGSSILIASGLSDSVGSANVKELHPFRYSAFVDTVTNFVRGIVLQLECVRGIPVRVLGYRTGMLLPLKHGRNV